MFSIVLEKFSLLKLLSIVVDEFPIIRMFGAMLLLHETAIDGTGGAAPIIVRELMEEKEEDAEEKEEKDDGDGQKNEEVDEQGIKEDEPDSWEDYNSGGEDFLDEDFSDVDNFSDEDLLEDISEDVNEMVDGSDELVSCCYIYLFSAH